MIPSDPNVLILLFIDSFSSPSSIAFFAAAALGGVSGASGNHNEANATIAVAHRRKHIQRQIVSVLTANIGAKREASPIPIGPFERTAMDVANER